MSVIKFLTEQDFKNFTIKHITKKCKSIEELNKILNEAGPIISITFYNCNFLTEIPKIEGLIELTCYDCDNLSNFPKIDNLTELTILGCKKITNIPACQNLRHLKFDSDSIKTIELCPKLRFFTFRDDEKYLLWSKYCKKLQKAYPYLNHLLKKKNAQGFTNDLFRLLLKY